ncbi:MAG: succinic semialdehyde dehydrogenase [Propioniciclava sp.]
MAEADSKHRIAERYAAWLSQVVSSTGETAASYSPLDGRELAAVPQSSVADLDLAFERARAAWPRWAGTPPRQRARYFLALHDLLLDHHDSLCDLIILETGKARRDAHEELLHTALTARYLGRAAARHLRRERRPGAIPMATWLEVNHIPKGVVGVISPWNYPLTMAWSDGLAALAAGNAVVVKPDAQTMLTALAGRELFQAAGFDADLWQVVAGPGATIGTGIVDRADHLCFTGSTATGRTVAGLAAGRLVGVSLELGGKNPMLVLADADIPRAVEGAIRGCFANAGQLCVAFERIYVHRKVAAEFTAALVERVGRLDLSVGLGWSAEVGTLTSAAQLEKVTAHVADAQAQGVTVLAGGRARPDLAPFAYEPTVLSGVTPTMACYAAETFGPVVALYPVDSDEEAVTLANALPEGLHASVWSRSPAHGRTIARRLRCGTVNVNEAIAATFGSLAAPMGGMGVSGIGRRQGPEGLLRFTETQAVATQRLIPLGGWPGLTPEWFAQGMRAALRVLRQTPRA